MWDDISKEEKAQAIAAFEKREKQKYIVGKWIFIVTIAVQIVLFLLYLVVFRVWEDLSLKNILTGILFLSYVPIALLGNHFRYEEWYRYRQNLSNRTFLGILWSVKVVICLLMLMAGWSGLESRQVIFLITSILLDVVAAILYFKSQALKTYFYDRFEDF